MVEEDFQSKQHVTKHLTLGRFGVLSEVSEVNSAEENDYLNWKMYLARTLTPDRVSPFVLRQVTDASSKYRNAYKSYAFGPFQKMKMKWIWILVAAIVGILLLLYFTGNLVVM